MKNMYETLNRFSLLDRYFEKAEEDKQNFKSYKKKKFYQQALLLHETFFEFSA